MNFKMQFQQNAGVFTADGQQFGHIERVVLDPETYAITDIVVRTGNLFKKDEKVVSINLIADTTEETITLRDNPKGVDALPPFEEEHFLTTEDGEKPVASPQPPIVPGTVVPGFPIVNLQPPVSEEHVVAHTERNIPAGTVPLKEGAKVITQDGKHVGNVERVLADSEGEQATHLLVSSGLITKENKLIPIAWVQTLGEEEVHLNVEEPSVEDLANVIV